MSRPTYLQALTQRVLIYDGAMGTSIDDFDLTAEEILADIRGEAPTA